MRVVDDICYVCSHPNLSSFLIRLLSGYKKVQNAPEHLFSLRLCGGFGNTVTKMCLSNETMSVARLCGNIFSYAETISTSLRIQSTDPAPARFIRWNSNNHMYIILNVDGNCNGDPIRSGFGGVICNSSGDYMSGFSGFISNSNDILFAELTALHQGLILAISLNCGELACYSDSLLTVNLVKDELPQYHVYAVLIQNIKDMLNSRNYSLQHSLREGNQCADFMGKLGSSTDDVLTIHSSPPQGLQPLLRMDELGSLYVRR